MIDFTNGRRSKPSSSQPNLPAPAGFTPLPAGQLEVLRREIQTGLADVRKDAENDRDET